MSNELSDLFINERGYIGFGKFVEYLRTAEDRLSMSLPQYLKNTIVSSRVFIERPIASEPIIDDTLYCINNMYIAWILTALSMNQMVHGSTVRDRLSVVATESLSNITEFRSVNDIVNNFAAYAAKVGASSDKIGSSISDVRCPAIFTNNATMIPTISDTDDQEDNVGGMTGSKILEQKEFRLMGGTIVEVSFIVGKQKITTNILVQLRPSIITPEVAQQFFKLNFNLDMWQRWFKYKTGEIEFFKDFIFEIDLLTEKYDALKKDKTGELEDMLNRKKTALASYVAKIFGWRAERQNIANTVHIYSNKDFVAFCRNSNCNFKREEDRLKFFKRTMSMMCVVIDPEFELINIYIAGINGVGNYSYKQLTNVADKKQYDLTSVLRAFANTKAPMF